MCSGEIQSFDVELDFVNKTDGCARPGATAWARVADPTRDKIIISNN